MTKAAALANDGLLGGAYVVVGKIKDGKLADRAAELMAILDVRAKAQLDVLGELAANDPLLLDYYMVMAQRSLKGHPLESNLKSIAEKMNNGRHARNAANAAFEMFVKAWPKILVGGPVIASDAVPILEQVSKDAGPNSELGMMARELLALPQSTGK